MAKRIRKRRFRKIRDKIRKKMIQSENRRQGNLLDANLSTEIQWKYKRNRTREENFNRNRRNLRKREKGNIKEIEGILIQENERTKAQQKEQGNAGFKKPRDKTRGKTIY